MKAKLGSHEPLRILVIDEDPVVRRLCRAALASPALALADAESLTAALPRLAGIDAAVVAIDAEVSAIAALRGAGFGGRIIAASRTGSVALAVAAMRAGADDVIVKPFKPADLVRRLTAAPARVHRPRAAVTEPAASFEGFKGFEGFLGSSPAMRDVFAQIVRIAPSKAPVFITGESGTGKEITAEAIHARSPRAGSAFIALNCGAIPKDLMESEIFGHLKGSFTGAHEDRAGAAEAADGGTLFLDEICEMELSLQAKLLRFIQTGELRRVGDTKTRAVDVRFVCATNRDPAAEVQAGRFREDLFYRLDVLPIHLPPLRARGADVVVLARAFLSRFAAEEGRHFAGFAPEAERLIASCDWPGNVRQLQNVIRRVVVLHDGELVTADMLALPLVSSGSPLAAPPVRDEIEPFAVQEQRIIERAVETCQGNVPKAAAMLGLAPSTIYRKRQSWAVAG